MRIPAVIALMIGVLVAPVSAGVSQASATSPTVSAVIATMNGCDTPAWMAVSADDTVYVPCAGEGTIAIINPSRANTIDSKLAVGVEPASIVVTTNVMYVANYLSNSVSTFPLSDPSAANRDEIAVGSNPAFGMVATRDDSVYVVNTGQFFIDDDSISIIGPDQVSGSALPELLIGSDMYGIAALDDSLFGALPFDDSIMVININGGTNSYVAMENVFNVAVDDDTLYALGFVDGAPSNLWQLDPSTLEVIGLPLSIAEGGVTQMILSDAKVTIASGLTSGVLTTVDRTTFSVEGVVELPSGPGVSVAATSSGYTFAGSGTTDDSSFISTIAPVNVTIDRTSARVGDVVMLDVTNTLGGVAPDDSTLQSVTLNGQTLALTGGPVSANTRRYTSVVPVGASSGSIVAALRGGNSTTVGAFVVEDGPDPSPPAPVALPPSAPTAAVAQAGDSSITVQWSPPLSTGSFPISTYQVSGLPAGSCVVTAPATTCDIEDLPNGVAHTFQVRALNGAGWSPWSTSTPDVTPEPAEVVSILIAGSRTDMRGRSGVRVAGVTSGLGMGAVVRPWVRLPGQTSFTQGSAQVLVNMEGEFTWQRRVGKKVTVFFSSEDGLVKSKRVTIQRR